MMNGATSRARPWFKLVALDEKAGNTTEAKRWFADVEKIIHAYFQVGNLYRVLPMAYKDVGIFDNAAYGMIPHDRFAFQFLPFAVGTYCFANDSEGNVTTFMRDFTLTVRQTVEMFATTNASGHIDWTKFDPWVKSAWEQSRYQDLVFLVNTIVPNDAPVPNALYARDKAYQSYTYVNGVGANVPIQSPMGSRNAPSYDRQQFLSIKGYDYFPVITPRWEVAPESDYGDEGPGAIAFADVKTLQEIEKDRLDAAAKLIKPPMVGPAALRRVQASILAGGITYLDEQDSTKQFRPAFTVDPKINELLDVRSDYVDAIRSAFFEDLFLMLADEKRISHVTAREIDERAAEKLSALGPVLGQLDQDQNRRLVENAFFLLNAQGKLPPKPKSLQNTQIRPEYISILAQAQKASLITSAEKLVGFTTSTANAFQDASLLKIVKADQLVREYADYLGVDPKFIRDEIEYEEIARQTALIEARARQEAMLKERSESLKNLSQAETGNESALDFYQSAQQAV